MSGNQKVKKKKPADGPVGKPADLPAGVTAQSFVEHWNASPSLKKFADGLGLAVSTCALYATRLRGAGHALKTFPRGRPRLLNM